MGEAPRLVNFYELFPASSSCLLSLSFQCGVRPAPPAVKYPQIFLIYIRCLWKCTRSFKAANLQIIYFNEKDNFYICIPFHHSNLKFTKVSLRGKISNKRDDFQTQDLQEESAISSNSGGGGGSAILHMGKTRHRL